MKLTGNQSSFESKWNTVDGQMSKLYSIAIWFRKKSHDEQDLGLMESFDWKQTFSFIQVYTSAPPTIRLCSTLSAAINQIEQTHRSPVKKSINWRHHSTFNNHRRISFHKYEIIFHRCGKIKLWSHVIFEHMPRSMPIRRPDELEEALGWETYGQLGMKVAKIDSN